MNKDIDRGPINFINRSVRFIGVGLAAGSTFLIPASAEARGSESPKHLVSSISNKDNGHTVMVAEGKPVLVNFDSDTKFFGQNLEVQNLSGGDIAEVKKSLTLIKRNKKTGDEKFQGTLAIGVPQDGQAEVLATITEIAECEDTDELIAGCMSPQTLAMSVTLRVVPKTGKNK